MYPTYVLQWQIRGEWCEIGWLASTPDSVRDLQAHGQRLADASPGEAYRLAVLSPFLDGDPTPVHAFVPTVGAA